MNVVGVIVVKLMQDGPAYYVVVVYGLINNKKWNFIILIKITASNHLDSDSMYKCMVVSCVPHNGYKITHDHSWP